jgi:FkbM family methyltransferase
MAKEPKDAASSRRTTIRKLVLRIILGSTLPVAEKFTLIALLLSGEVSERRTRIQTALWQAAKKILKKRKSLMKKISLRRTLRRIKSLVTGQRFRPSNPRLSKEDREQRKKERLNERRRAKGVLNFKADLEAPDVDFLAERERERARLEASGWIFAQPKRLKLINDRRITTILDCGANSGQYVDDLKKARWAGKVYSFEPLSEAYAILSGKAVASDQWQAFHCALGEENGESTIQVAGNSYSSSLLEFSTDFKELRPDASPVGSETVTIRRLDDVVKEEGFSFDGPVMLKLDVQGFELSVLRGALETLPRVSVIQCELALIPSYEGGATFVEVREFLRDQGFVLAHLIDGHANHETGELREVDGIFLNVRLAPVES